MSQVEEQRQKELSVLIQLLNKYDFRAFANGKRVNQAGHPRVVMSVHSVRGGVDSQNRPKRQFLNRAVLESTGAWGWALGRDFNEGGAPVNQAPTAPIDTSCIQ